MAPSRTVGGGLVRGGRLSPARRSGGPRGADVHRRARSRPGGTGPGAPATPLAPALPTDYAFAIIVYNINFAWAIDGNVDVETIVLHEAGHGLAQAHFGKGFLKPNGKLHFAPRRDERRLHRRPAVAEGHGPGRPLQHVRLLARQLSPTG